MCLLIKQDKIKSKNFPRAFMLLFGVLWYFPVIGFGSDFARPYSKF